MPRPNIEDRDPTENDISKVYKYEDGTTLEHFFQTGEIWVNTKKDNIFIFTARIKQKAIWKNMAGDSDNYDMLEVKNN